MMKEEENPVKEEEILSEEEVKEKEIFTITANEEHPVKEERIFEEEEEEDEEEEEEDEEDSLVKIEVILPEDEENLVKEEVLLPEETSLLEEYEINVFQIQGDEIPCDSDLGPEISVKELKAVKGCVDSSGGETISTLIKPCDDINLFYL
ncbi:hypothetical protein E2320_014754 [Naja naja]|nr:hypothetical protein E2320_014754 [Naja naja]